MKWIHFCKRSCLDELSEPRSRQGPLRKILIGVLLSLNLISYHSSLKVELHELDHLMNKLDQGKVFEIGIPLGINGIKLIHYPDSSEIQDWLNKKAYMSRVGLAYCTPTTLTSSINKEPQCFALFYQVFELFLSLKENSREFFYKIVGWQSSLHRSIDAIWCFSILRTVFKFTSKLSSP